MLKLTGMPISTDRIALARRLEVPVFNLMKDQLQTKLGRPTRGGVSGEPWKVVWDGAHLYKLLYFRRPQTADANDQPLPDFILKVDERPRLAVECKNWSVTSKWSKGSAKKQIIDRFTWLPASCKRVVLASHLQANGLGETMDIRRMLVDADVKMCVLGHPVGYPPLTRERTYRRLAPIVSEWLTFIRKRNKRTRRAKGQKPISEYV